MKRAAIVGLALLAACPSQARDDPPSTTQSKPEPGVSDEERAAAHRDAFAALLPMATEAMKLADPVAAAQIGLGPLGPTPTSPGERETLRVSTERARAEAGEIDEHVLEPKQQIALRTMRFVLARIHDGLTRHPPARNDATVIPLECERVLEELEYRALFGDCSDCERVLDSLIAPLDTLPAELTASSPAGLDAAHADLQRLRGRVEAFASRTSDAAALAEVTARLVTQIDETRAALDERRTQLPSAPSHTWEDRPPARGASPVTLQLPDRLGARALVRRLEVEESLAVEIEALMSGAKRNLARFSAMHDELAGDAAPADRARPVDATRCRAAWKTLTETTLRQPGFEDAAIDCDALARHLRGQGLDDADLLITIVDLGVVEPVRRAFRRSQDPGVALASGAWAPASARILRRIMILGPTRDRVAMGRAIDEGRDALCAASASLWIHAALGDDSTLAAWLREACPARTPDEWITMALAHPRQSLTGLGIASVSAEPASMVGIDMFYWAPLGLVPLLATPPEALAPPETPQEPPVLPGPGPDLEVKLEELDG